VATTTSESSGAHPAADAHHRQRRLDAAPRPGFGAALAAEWTKLSTVRSTAWSLLAMVVLTPAVAVLVAATRSLAPGDTIVASSLMGAAVAQLFAAVVGVLVMTSEHATGTIRVTLAACPRRLPVLLAKAAVVAAVLLVLAGASSLAAYQLGGLLLADGPYPHGDPVPALLGTAVHAAVVGMLGLALGVILRHAAGAISAVLGVLLLPYVVGGMLPATWARWVVGACPTTALLKLHAGDGGAVDAAAMGSLGAWPTLGLVGAYTLATLLVGAWLLTIRDA
jgi:ABC-2 type transport system permease protein